ncbi:hypothetical protein P3L10_008847 [Capsicum annuum]
MSFNKQNQTPLDIVLSCTITTKEKLVKDLCSISRFKKCDFKVKRKYKYMYNPNAETGTGVKMQLREVDHDKVKKADQTEVESIMKEAQIHIIVAILITTVTFDTSITLPGGFESGSDSPNQGMTILIRKTTFRTFVVSDVIAFTFSAVAIFIYFLMADTSRDPQSKKIVKKPYDLACIFQCLSMLVVVIAFVMGMFATLSYFIGLAVTIYSIGCLSILLYFLVVIYICRYTKNINDDLKDFCHEIGVAIEDHVALWSDLVAIFFIPFQMISEQKIAISDIGRKRPFTIAALNTTYCNAAMRGNIGDGNFLFADHLKWDEENGHVVTPKGNTVLHVASLYGYSHFMAEVLKITPTLLCCQNK